MNQNYHSLLLSMKKSGFSLHSPILIHIKIAKRLLTRLKSNILSIRKYIFMIKYYAGQASLAKFILLPLQIGGI